MVLIMDNSKEKQEYKDWFYSTFNESEIDFLSSIGVTCGADHQYFKFEILNNSEHLDNYKLKKNKYLYEKFLDRFIELTPQYLRHLINRNLLKDDKYYVAWFFNRHCFFKKIDEVKSSYLNAVAYRGEYVQWVPIIDINSPEECKIFNNKIYHIQDEKFLEIAVDHWANVRRGCRCALMALSKEQVNKRQSVG